MAGVYPAAVTPLAPTRKLDLASMAKLLAFFESRQCQGAVIAGTNGEGPSLSATEKRELIEFSCTNRGQLKIILGIASASIEEAKWLSRRAGDSGASAVLVMAPGYFREAPESGVRDFFLELLEASPIPVIAYNFPKRTGFTISAAFLGTLAAHPNFAGVKDSSGDQENIKSYAAALDLSRHRLFVGDETLLTQALEAGWSGTISGASNVLAGWLSQLCADYFEGRAESAHAKFEFVRALLTAIRSSPQPQTHKLILAMESVIVSPTVQLPLELPDRAAAEALRQTIIDTLGRI